MTITTLGVIGTGAMGSGIIEVAAKAGVTVIARDINAADVEAGQGKVERGKLDEAARDAAVANITWTTDLADLAPCDLVIEAAPENLELKKEIFVELDSILGPDAVSYTHLTLPTKA